MARTACRSSSASNCGVTAGFGPSSKVSAICLAAACGTASGPNSCEVGYGAPRQNSGGSHRCGRHDGQGFIPPAPGKLNVHFHGWVTGRLCDRAARNAQAKL